MANRLSSKLGKDFGLEPDPVLDILGNFISHYIRGRTKEEKNEADVLTYGFIDSQIRDPIKRSKYRRVYLFATGREEDQTSERKKRPSTRMMPVGKN